MTDDLIAWLRAQLDDDERLAQEAAMWTAPTWRYGEYPAEAHHVEVAEHIERHDPARVLAEVDAKRRILDLCEYEQIDVGTPGRPEFVPGLRPPFAHPVVRLLALPYADQPGYRPEWAPDA